VITAIVSCCRRLHNLEEIFARVRAQSVPCREIRLFYNGKQPLAGISLPPFDRVVVSSAAEDYYGRYAVALTAASEFVWILDDDCLPQERWVEHCLATERRVGGILAPGGFRVRSRGFARRDYRDIDAVGEAVRPSPEPLPQEIDVPYHSYFLRRALLTHLFRHPISVGREGGETVPLLGGDDIALACRAWLHAGARSFVPSCAEPGTLGASAEVDERAHASWVHREGFQRQRLQALRYEAWLGWKPIRLRRPWETRWRALRGR
jgi:hypothetical protein